jgi:hypothetical protein
MSFFQCPKVIWVDGNMSKKLWIGESSVTTFCRCRYYSSSLSHYCFSVCLSQKQVLGGRSSSTESSAHLAAWQRRGWQTLLGLLRKIRSVSSASHSPASTPSHAVHSTRSSSFAQSLRAARLPPAKRQLAAHNRAPLFFTGETIVSGLKWHLT